MQVQIPTLNVHKDRAQGCVLPESLGSGTSSKIKIANARLFWLALFPFFRRLESLFKSKGVHLGYQARVSGGLCKLSGRQTSLAEITLQYVLGRQVSYLRLVRWCIPEDCLYAIVSRPARLWRSRLKSDSCSNENIGRYGIFSLHQFRLGKDPNTNLFFFLDFGVDRADERPRSSRSDEPSIPVSDFAGHRGLE